MNPAPRTYVRGIRLFAPWVLFNIPPWIDIHGFLWGWMNKKTILVFVFLTSMSPSIFAQGGVPEAMSLINDGKNDEAIAVLNKEIEKSPSSSEAYMALGLAFLEKGNYAESKVNLEKSLELNPSSVLAQFTLAMLYEKEKEYPKAISEWKNVLRLCTDKNLKNLALKHIRHLEGNK